MGIGTKLSELIEANGTNPNELAKKIGVAPTTIYSIIKRDSKSRHRSLIKNCRLVWCYC